MAKSNTLIGTIKYNLSPETLLATFDVIGLFTNIIHNEGLKATENMLEKR